MTNEPSIKKYQIAERRAQAWQLRIVHKKKEREIAAELGVTERTIRKDLVHARCQNHRLLKELARFEQAVSDIGLEVREETEAVTRQAWEDYHAAPPGNPQRARCLNLVLKSLQRRVEILDSLGLIKEYDSNYLMRKLDEGVGARIRLKREQEEAAKEAAEDEMLEAEAAKMRAAGASGEEIFNHINALIRARDITDSLADDN